MIWLCNKAGEYPGQNRNGKPVLTSDSVIYKLFLRAFPNHFKGDSIYAHYPMTIPRHGSLSDSAISGFFSTDSS